MILLPFRVGGMVRMIGRSRRGARIIAPWQRNLIPDSGLDLIGTTNTYLDACQVGVSAVEPTPAHTALLDPIAGTANRIQANSAAANSEPWRGFSQITYRFPAGTFSGQLIREIGISPSATPGDPVFSRVLVRSALGQAFGVRVLDDEELDVEYELSCYAPQADVAGTVEIDGNIHNYVSRAALASTGQHWAPYRSGSFGSSGQAAQAIFATTSGAHAVAYSGAIGSITSSPGGSSANASSVGNTAYTPGSFIRLATFGWDLDVANFGIRSVLLRMAPGTGSGGNSLGAYQIEFTPVINKTSALAFRFDAGFSWGRL